MFLSDLCARDANNVQSKATGLRREQEGRLKIRLFFVHPEVLHSRVLTIIPDYHSRAFVKWKGGGGGRAFCFIVYVVRNLVEKDGEGWRRILWPELFSRAHMEGL